MIIHVGLPTEGAPRLSEKDGTTLLENLLIGKGFHWQKSVSALIPGRVERTGNPDFPLICSIDIEKYLECVAGSEMNPGSPIELLKAHAVISRSWAVGKVLHTHPEGGEAGRVREPLKIVDWEDTADHMGFDVCSDDHCQRFQGLQPISDEAHRAIAETEGIVLADAYGRLVDARFSKCCGGRTEIFSTCWQDREMPCIGSVEDPYCDLSDLPGMPDNPSIKNRLLKTVLKDYDLATGGGHDWRVEISKSKVSDNLRMRFGMDIGEVIAMKPLERGASGRIKLLEITGSKSVAVIGKELKIRELLSDTHLYSSWFDIEDTGTGFRLVGRGWGHGAGLCQVGAARMAFEGMKCGEILSHYYPGSHLVNLADLKP